MLAELGEDAPRQVGPYRILARLGAGGMGEVYLGADARPDPAGPERPRLAAVKTIRADLGGDPAFRDRFRREIATARTVEGRFTARLLSGDAEAAQPWMATEYVAGPTLERAVRDTGPLPAGTVRRLGLGLVRALRAIHHARVQHRDLKPANVLLGTDGPRVIDFGIARDFGAATLTATGAMVGSPGYMSPEHVLGGRHVVAASDIFCLGAVLCYAATGESPFGHGPVAAVLYRISQADADLGAVPEELRELIVDCLSADPFARPDAVALESRFTAAAQAAGESADADPWPPAVQALVARYEKELARVVAQAGPAAVPVPTMPGTSPVHSAETVGGPPPDPVPPSPSRPARPSRRTVLTVIAAAVVVGVLGAIGLRAVQNASEPQREEAAGNSASPSPSPSATAEAEAEALEKPVGFDEYGVDGSRHFPVDPSARPAGWKPWTAKLASRPAECTLNPELLVCLTEDGGMVALGAADGRPRWKAPSTVPGGKAEQTPLHGVRYPGGAKEPVIHGDLVISYASGKVRARSVSDGKVRWEQGVADVELANKVPLLVGGGAVFLTAQGAEGVTVHAFDADTGDPLWNRTLSNQTGISSGGSHYRMWAYAGGRVLGTTEGGLTGFAARTGAATHFAPAGGGDCASIRAVGGEVQCDAGGETVTLDEKTLRQVGDATPSLPGQYGLPSPIVVGSTQYRLESADDGDRVVLRKEGEPSARTVARFPRTEQGVRTSVPTIVGTTAVVADNEFLYTLPVSSDGRKRYRITGAPGNGYRVEDAGFGMDRWGPKLISLGGLLYLAFHDGTVRSFELPTA
jgi:serine/threonine protein kinase